MAKALKYKAVIDSYCWSSSRKPHEKTEKGEK